MDLQGGFMRFTSIALTTLLLAVGVSAMAQSQTPVPAKALTGNFGAGFAITGGNTDTNSFNLSFEATHDPKAKNVIKTRGLYLRSSSNNELTSDSLRLSFRDDYLLSKRVSVYGALGYLRDPFKSISYLLNPQGGLGFKVYDSEKAAFSLSGGAGAVWEKNEGIDVRTSGTLNAGQSFSYKLSEHAKLTQNLTGMWKTKELADALYHFDIALVTTIVQRLEAKIEFMDEYKNRPPFATIKKNDTAFITSLLYKF
jgi:putative salt-induced outer membrane protein YdiY